ncbi:MAG: S49 family peptidase, partial [Geminicoccaceae bacterium]|nr:S49 family peptidase [Geminicoccaceae bacterium]
ALDNVTEKGLTPANAEMLNDVADSLFGQLVAAVAEGRGLPPERVRALIDGGPYLAEDALDGGLIDGLAYEDEALHFALAKADLGGEPGSGHDTRAVGLDRYAGAVGTGADDDGSAPRVALVRAAGAVTRGSALPGEAIAADDTAELLLSLRKDPDVRAVVLRLDTPGGSAVASETVGREVRELVASGRPVVVSMGNAAASGGYWISMGASRIVAQPGTLTGSIGVFAAKPVVGEALSKLDVNVAEIDRGEHADLWSLAKGYDPADRAKVEGIVGGLYDRFKAGVAKGRGLDPAEVERIAQGRVWTGERALGLRLVDRLGGLGEAFAETRTLLDLPADAPLDVRLYPEPKNPVEAVVAWFEGGGGLLGFAARIETALGAALDGGLLARSPVLRVR